MKYTKISDEQAKEIESLLLPNEYAVRLVDWQPKYITSTGTLDALPDDAARWQRVEIVSENYKIKQLPEEHIPVIQRTIADNTFVRVYYRDAAYVITKNRVFAMAEFKNSA